MRRVLGRGRGRAAGGKCGVPIFVKERVTWMDEGGYLMFV